MIDHLRNTQSVGLEDLAVLVLDEADRLLEMGFAEEVGAGWRAFGVCVRGGRGVRRLCGCRPARPGRVKQMALAALWTQHVRRSALTAVLLRPSLRRSRCNQASAVGPACPNSLKT